MAGKIEADELVPFVTESPGTISRNHFVSQYALRILNIIGNTCVVRCICVVNIVEPKTFVFIYSNK